VVLPGLAILLTLRFSVFGLESGLLRVLTVEAIGYVAFWAAFPLVMHYLTQALGLGDRYRMHIVAYNWSQVIQIAVWVPLNLFVVATGLARTAQAELIILVMYFAIVAYEGYIAHVTLKVPRMGAVGIAMLSFVIAYMLEVTSFALQHPGQPGG